MPIPITRPEASAEEPGPRSVAVGIDAGGSSIRVRAVSDGQVLFNGAGGPGNPLSVDEATLKANFAAAVSGCPAADRVAACVSGTGSHERRVQVCGMLTDFFPGAAVTVFPDYVAALSAAPAGSDVVVIAGTGSLVCSGSLAGVHAVSGGRGWILGDHGSASRLGRAALEWYCADPEAAPPDFAAAVERATGLRAWRSIVRAVSASASPAALLAQAAPLLTRAAQEGMAWAVASLDAEMTALAVTTLRHIDRHLAGREDVRVALSGGVWTSSIARQSFAAALTRVAERRVIVQRSKLSPLDGAVRLAMSVNHE